jgi:hypothetical protein
VKRTAAAAACVVVLVAGCSGASNSGGKTTCADFLAMRTDDQDATVAKLLKERNGRNSATGEIVDKRESIVESCGADDRADAEIGGLG